MRVLFVPLHPHSSSGGSSSSKCRINDILISVVSFPLNTSLIKCASTCKCTCTMIRFSIIKRRSTNHLQSSPYNSTQNIRVPKLVLRPSIIRQFNEVCQGVLLEYQRKLFAVARPIRDRGCNVEKYLESNLIPASTIIALS